MTMYYPQKYEFGTRRSIYMLQLYKAYNFYNYTGISYSCLSWYCLNTEQITEHHLSLELA